MVMRAFLSLSRRAVWAFSAAPRSMLETTSPLTSTKSLLMMSLMSTSRNASPAVLHAVDTITCPAHKGLLPPDTRPTSGLVALQRTIELRNASDQHRAHPGHLPAAACPVVLTNNCLPCYPTFPVLSRPLTTRGLL